VGENHISEKGLLFKIHKELLYIKTSKQLSDKMGKRFDITKEERWLAKKHMKRSRYH
jgi:hypothetical protein